MTPAEPVTMPPVPPPAADHDDVPADDARSAPDAAELDSLREAFREFAATTERLQDSHRHLQEEVGRLQAELERKNEMLRRKERLAALGEMAAGIAHEIRNPLGGVRLTAGLLSRQVEGEEAERLLRRITDGVADVDKIIGDVLAFAGGLTAEPVPGDLVETVARAAVDRTGVSPAAPADDTGDEPALDLHLPDALAARFDAGLVARAVHNLVANAAAVLGDQRAAGERTDPGTVRVTLAAEDDHAVLTVTDDGPGIPEDLRPRLFNPFVTGRDRGTGLGLAIVHRIVEAHDGTVAADNPEAGGARFTVRLPTAGPAERQVDATPDVAPDDDTTTGGAP